MLGSATAINRRWTRAGWLLLIALMVALESPPPVPRTQASTPALTLEICRASVEPCQNRLSIPENGAVDLDLVLSSPPGAADPSSVPIVGWQTRLRQGESLAVEPVSWLPSGPPVREQGEAELALNGLAPLSSSAHPDAGRYFTVQNRYRANSGQLDYAVTLVRPHSSSPQPGVLPLPSGSRLLLGRITARGSAAGTSFLRVDDSGPDPVQVVTLDPGGGLRAVFPGTVTGPLAEINVGGVTTPELSGQTGYGEPGGSTLPVPYTGELSVSFWQVGAKPPWRGGSHGPVAAFHRVATDAQGAFRITDIAPSLVPPGVYDLRVQGRGTLASRVPSVAVPGPPGTGAAPPIPLDGAVGLRAGDIDGSNVVDQADLQALRASFALLAAQAGSNLDADFNGDGVVDVLDFSIMAQNFGQRGD